MDLPVTRIKAENFRSLRDVDVSLGPLNVLVGPNGAGKSNLLNVLQFLADTVRFDLSAALDAWRGFEHVQRQAERTGPVKLTVEGQVTSNASANALDRYSLRLNKTSTGIRRDEEFAFKRTSGAGRRIKVTGVTVTIEDDERPEIDLKLATKQTTGLATLPKFADDEGGLGIRQFTKFLSGIRVIEPDVAAARDPGRMVGGQLAQDASNLPDALHRLSTVDPDSFALLKDDVARCLPGLKDIRFVPVGGGTRNVVVQLVEQGVSTPIDLVDASFGTVRLLALLTALHDPEPALFTAIEEVDHGLHPYALEVLVERMRAASARTQILAATHSPTLANRLRPEEIIICDRDPESGESLIPSRTAGEITDALGGSDWQIGELWFAGALGGVPV